MQWEKFTSRIKTRNDQINLPIVIDGGKKILICLPENNIDKVSCQTIILKYQTLFLGHPIQFCALSEFAPFIQSSCNCLFYTYSSLSFTNRLEDSIKQVLLATQYQLAIDLNQHFSLAASIICKTTGALTRISFVKPNARLFYNVLLNPEHSGLSVQNNLEIMKHTLQSIIQIKQ